MNKIKNILKDNKKIVIIGGVLVVLLVIVIVLLMSLDGKEEPTISLEDSLSNFGGKFYTDYYYQRTKDKNDLKKHKDNGLNLTITNLEVLMPLDKETKKMFDDKKCDYDNSKLIIYPKEPYGKNDYIVKVELTCEK